MKTKKDIISFLVFLLLFIVFAVLFFRESDQKGNKVSEVNETEYTDEPVWMQFAFFPANYAQVSEGDYYYLRGGEDEIYTIYKNRGEKLVSFPLCEKGRNCYITGFARYKGEFYLLVEDDDKSQLRLQRLDRKSGNLVTLNGNIGPLGAEHLDFSHRYYLYKDYMLAKDNTDNISAVPLFGNSDTIMHDINFPDTLGKDNFDYESKIKEKAYFTYQNDEMYLGFQDGKNVSLFKANCKSLFRRFESTIAIKQFDSYEADSAKKTDLVITFDEDYMYSQNWAISKKNGGKKKFAEGDVKAVSTTPKYIFYIDGDFRIHRVDKKDFKDTMISDIKAAGIDCVDNGIYVREYDEILYYTQKYFDFPDELPGTVGKYKYYQYSNAVYYMDFNGEHVETVVEADTDAKEISYSNYNFSDRTGEKLSDIMQNVDFGSQGASTVYHNMAMGNNGNVQADGHFYYITFDKKGDMDEESLDKENITYTVYRDRGEKVKTFTMKGELVSCIFYHNKIYLERGLFDPSAQKRIYHFERLKKDGKLTDLPRGLYGYNFIVYKDKVFSCESIDDSESIVWVKEDGSEEILVKKIMGGEVGTCQIMDGKMYYAVPKDGKTSLYYIDLATGEQVRFYSYEKETRMEVPEPVLSMDSDFIYCGRDRISIRTGEVKRYPLDVGTTFTSTRQYIFYVDKNNRLHRIDKKTDRDRIITTKKITQVNATEEGLFVEKYDQKMEKKIDKDFDDDGDYVWYNYYPTNRYYMDFDGKNMEKLPGVD